MPLCVMHAGHNIMHTIRMKDTHAIKAIKYACEWSLILQHCIIKCISTTIILFVGADSKIVLAYNTRVCVVRYM